MIVMKFGGTSLAGPHEVRQVGAIIRRFAGRIFSALGDNRVNVVAIAQAS